MSKKLIAGGVFGLALCMAAGGAQAKLIRYEIDGKRYSYSTNNIQQTREARRRIEAANAALAAQTSAEAERAGNPLVKIFGSRTQREAAAARKRLEETLSPRAAPDDDADLESTSSLKRSRVEVRLANDAKARAERRRAVREARLERRKLNSARAQRRAALAAETQRAAPRKEVARPVETRHRAEPRLQGADIIHVSNDPPAKTTFPETGSMESAASLMEFVNQVRKALP